MTGKNPSSDRAWDWFDLPNVLALAWYVHASLIAQNVVTHRCSLMVPPNCLNYGLQVTSDEMPHFQSLALLALTLFWFLKVTGINSNVKSKSDTWIIKVTS